jgi:uncharacterized protein
LLNSLSETVIIVTKPLSPFRLNVGFIVHQTVGFSRDFEFEIPEVRFPPDLELIGLNGIVRVTRTPQGLLVQVKMSANTKSQCVRCLNDYAQTLDIDFTELYAFSKRSTTESDLLLPEDGHIDFEPLIREYMLLEVPIGPLCSIDCKGLCAICGENLNDHPHNHDTETGDPRLSVLKSLLDQDQSSEQQ